MQVQKYSHLARYLRVLSNPLRVSIIYLLENFEKSVNEIVEHSGASQCYVSQQLQHLATQGLLTRREEGTKVYYNLKDKRILNIPQLVCNSICWLKF